MALKKSQIYASLWQSCDELRGGMDASQYKDYVLTLLFMKYVSDKADEPDALIDVPADGSFSDMAACKGDKEIGDRINKIIGRLAEANGLKGVIDQADFNDESKLGAGKEMQDRLSKLVAIFEGLDFRANRAEGDDLLGDAYEYLMRHFATESGKAKGQFYTPSEVSRVMAQVIGIGPHTRQDETIYDLACGSGSLLLKAADLAPRGLSIYGQEMDNATWALAKMNMILHGHETAELWRGNTLASPYYKNAAKGLKTFDFAVANPPFSAKAWGHGFDPAHDEFGRFEYGIPPDKNGDYAFLLHLVKSLKRRGKGAIILPHGVLFRGNKEADIRKNLVRRGFIKGIIGLPANLFYGTGIPACILVIDKENAHARKGIFMIDASRGFLKDGNKNRLRAQDIHRIVDVFNNQIERPGYARMVSVAEIASPANAYNLNLPRYIDASAPEDLHDLHAHYHGGIPDRDLDALRDYWKVFPALRESLFESDGQPGYSEARVETERVKAAILDHEEFKGYRDRVTAVFAAWCAAHKGRLRGLGGDDRPAAIIDELSEDLLARFADLPLLDPYDVYQCLMDYWDETMQDDVYLIAADGYVEAAKPRGIIEDRAKKIKETPDLIVKRKKYKMDLIPPARIVARYFAADRSALDALRVAQEDAARALEEFVEEHTGEGGLLEDAINDKGKVTKKDTDNRLKAMRDEPDPDRERAALTRCLALFQAKSKSDKAAKDARAELDARVLACYAALTYPEIETLVIEDKWFADIRRMIDNEVQRLTQHLAARVKELEERYARPLPALEREVAMLGAKVEGHLEKILRGHQGRLEAEPLTRPAAGDILQLAAQVYRGLSEKDIDEIETIARH